MCFTWPLEAQRADSDVTYDERYGDAPVQALISGAL